jgi:hypothetical protein
MVPHPTRQSPNKYKTWRKPYFFLIHCWKDYFILIKIIKKKKKKKSVSKHYSVRQSRYFLTLLGKSQYSWWSRVTARRLVREPDYIVDPCTGYSPKSRRQKVYPYAFVLGMNNSRPQASCWIHWCSWNWPVK